MYISNNNGGCLDSLMIGGTQCRPHDSLSLERLWLFGDCAFILYVLKVMYVKNYGWAYIP